jgi:membrane associated rhomboid family serine protease
MRLPRTATFAIGVLTVVAGLIISVTIGVNSAAVMLGVIPARLSGVLDISPAVPAFLTPLTSALVHDDLFHLAFNLLFLWWCGSAVERVLGQGSLIALYIVGAFAAAAAQWAVAPLSAIPVIGASGAISAVIGAFALSFGQQKRLVRSPTLNRWLNALWLLAAWLVLQLLLGWAAGEQGVLLATPAHIGGFVVGLALQRPLLLWRYRKA